MAYNVLTLYSYVVCFVCVCCTVYRLTRQLKSCTNEVMTFRTALGGRSSCAQDETREVQVVLYSCVHARWSKQVRIGYIIYTVYSVYPGCPLKGSEQPTFTVHSLTPRTHGRSWPCVSAPHNHWIRISHDAAYIMHDDEYGCSS